MGKQVFALDPCGYHGMCLSGLGLGLGLGRVRVRVRVRVRSSILF
jgi:hypothetical protein